MGGPFITSSRIRAKRFKLLGAKKVSFLSRGVTFVLGKREMCKPEESPLFPHNANLGIHRTTYPQALLHKKRLLHQAMWIQSPDNHQYHGHRLLV